MTGADGVNGELCRAVTPSVLPKSLPCGSMSAIFSPMEAPLEVTVTEAAVLAKRPDTLLLDVREPHEWAVCHVEGSHHFPMGTIPARLADLPRDRPILVLCHHGGRSMRVTQFLRANDFPLVSNVEGGIEAWAEIVDPSLPRY